MARSRVPAGPARQPEPFDQPSLQPARDRLPAPGQAAYGPAPDPITARPPVQRAPLRPAPDRASPARPGPEGGEPPRPSSRFPAPAVPKLPHLPNLPGTPTPAGSGSGANVGPPPSGARPPLGRPPGAPDAERPPIGTSLVVRPGSAMVLVRTGGSGALPVVATRDPKRTWQWVIGGLGVLVLLAVCGLGSFFIIADERQGRAGRDSADSSRPTAQPRDISSRTVDPAPLTESEVFPAQQIVINPAEPAYQVLRTQTATDCASAATGEINTLLADLGCDQVVRGTLRSPTGNHLVTAGVFNLADATGAEWAHQKIKVIVDGGKGRFQGLAADKGTEAVTLASAQVGWHVRGHFLVYCVIARTDGTAIGDDDPYARQILFDMIELHLRGGVLERRATVPVDASAQATPAA
ncbi:hypothetical protein AB0J90_22670 [Micromonospora sp. NPDC049523]|uniref:hypothetical protein n=1 Tax=Micromonospora sp. NPDC049523 TaxID=3155921 RepID=UPI0034471988